MSNFGTKLSRYRDYNSYLKEIFGERVQKLSLDAGLGCPNRDGTISIGGCIYCDSRGSGTGALIEHHIPLEEQIISGIEAAKKRYKAKKYIAYFQSFTNTYAPVSKLKELYDKVLLYPDIVGLSVGTRPDCVSSQVLQLLDSYTSRYLVWIEYGLQSAHDSTLRFINRGHDVACFVDAIKRTARYGIKICVHVILGLPGESREMMMETARFISSLPIHGVKIHLLYVVKGTKMEEMVSNGQYRCLDRDEYIELVVDFLEQLPPQVVIQRLTGDPPRSSELVAPKWALEKSKLLGLIKKRLEERDTWQGRHFRGSMFSG